VSAYELIFPPEFLEYEYEYEAKGYLSGARIVVGERHADVVFYEPVRLGQDIAEEIADAGYLAFTNLVVVPQVTKDALIHAVDLLAEANFTELTFDADPSQ
jgi:hypothetical protein